MNTIKTASGRHIDLLNPNPDDLVIEDIAHALSNLCRYTGHSPSFYSVAQHSVLVSHRVGDCPRMQMFGLLHDAPEAYLGDVSTPLKSLIVGYKELEGLFMDHIAAKFIGGYPLVIPPLVHEADRLVLSLEQRSFLNDPSVRIDPYPPGQAREEFFHRYVTIAQRLAKAYPDSI